MPAYHHISPDILTTSTIDQIFHSNKKIALSIDSQELIKNCQQYLEDAIQQTDRLIYGINTGFGSLCNMRIPEDQLEQLQHNLVTSHASGTGEEVPIPVVRLMILLKIQSLSYGHSGIQLSTVQRLVDFFNFGVSPVVYQQGSLGASGDLAPLAHLSLPLLGMGEVYFENKKQPTQYVLDKLNLDPIKLGAKEGIALLNGTQFSTAYGVWAQIQADRLSRWSDLIAALSIEAFNCRTSPFDERLHRIRAHNGQVSVAQNIRTLLEGSGIRKLKKTDVQDPYAFRCVPQVHGASADALAYTSTILTTEINSVTDNPNIFPDTDAVLSGGNFHAQPIALALDFMAIALSELGSISERRVYQLISGQRNLPPFLVAKPGINSGLMIAQYTAASIVSQNKQLCTPASVDSIVSCNGQEDHVSMAANAGTKLYKVVNNLESLLAIELMTAAQAFYFRKKRTDVHSSPVIEKLIAAYREEVSVLQEDRVIQEDIAKTVGFMRRHEA